MSKATNSTTTSRDSWRNWQLRRRANGKGKHPLPAGRYSTTKKTLHHGVQPRPLSAAQTRTLWEFCTLTAYHPDGFTWTREMEAVCQAIADRSSPAAIDACLARADIRERSYVTR
jgi:hypothetical protein